MSSDPVDLRAHPHQRRRAEPPEEAGDDRQQQHHHDQRERPAEGGRPAAARPASRQVIGSARTVRSRWTETGRPRGGRYGGGSSVPEHPAGDRAGAGRRSSRVGGTRHQQDRMPTHDDDQRRRRPRRARSSTSAGTASSTCSAAYPVMPQPAGGRARAHASILADRAASDSGPAPPRPGSWDP